MRRFLMFMFTTGMLIWAGGSPASAGQENTCCFLFGVAQDVPTLSVEQFKRYRKQTDVIVLDTRSGDEFLKGFVPQSVNIGFKGPFDTFLMRVFPDKSQKLLVIVKDVERDAVLQRLLGLGYTRVIGTLIGGIIEWKCSEAVDSISDLTVSEFYKKSDQGHIVDVRTPEEFDRGHIDNAMNIPLLDFANFGNTLKNDSPWVFVHCQSGYRSVIAVSILRAKGFKHICNIQGGYKALKEEIKENNNGNF
ncbi:rhodanese-like domain-containing protein [Sphingobacterium sp. InxBP1]|uniref:rhodanese-like domain-containing protein n=1 Tax=Sphingobacterium sp. InxBP1 TaxID=2870328 RepID=UPI0022440D53|nr:rhodanese-like domain-containing protein [Sphingobacterium sp. InxBP1]MCW8309755.1 rhodanese-like domain-containing protein [Sphingobacterium sp. InxBP1]